MNLRSRYAGLVVLVSAALAAGGPAPANAAGTASCSAVLSAGAATYNPLRAAGTAVSRPATVRLTCGIFGLAAGQYYQVVLDVARNGPVHAMRGASSDAKPLSYDLYLPDGKVWLDGSGASGHYVTQFTASGMRTIPVELRIPAGQDAAVGAYVDSSLTFLVSVSGPY